jgi:hypothetical protein
MGEIDVSPRFLPLSLPHFVLFLLTAAALVFFILIFVVVIFFALFSILDRLAGEPSQASQCSPPVVTPW